MRFSAARTPLCAGFPTYCCHVVPMSLVATPHPDRGNQRGCNLVTAEIEAPSHALGSRGRDWTGLSVALILELCVCQYVRVSVHEGHDVGASCEPSVHFKMGYGLSSYSQRCKCVTIVIKD